MFCAVRTDIEEFLVCNNLGAYFLGVCQDLASPMFGGGSAILKFEIWYCIRLARTVKHFGWYVSVIILDKEGKRIVSLHRKEVIYCRFSKANKKGVIENVLYANWKKPVSSVEDIEIIPLLDETCPWHDLEERLKHGKARKFALVSRVPTPDSTYYPIPYYAALFRGKWYNIKQLIGMAKEAKLKRSAHKDALLCKELRSHQVSHRSVFEVLGEHFQTRAHH